MLAAQESWFTLLDGVLYYVDARHGNRRRVAATLATPEAHTDPKAIPDSWP